MAVKPVGIAATLSDAVALTAAFGSGTTIGLGEATAGCDIVAPAGLVLTLHEARTALALAAPQYVFTFGNAAADDQARTLGPIFDLLAQASGAGFLAACLATPWAGRTAYQGHLFDHGTLRGDMKRDLGPYVEGRIGVVEHSVVVAGVSAIRSKLTALKEQGVRLALLDAIDDAQCAIIAEAVARQPVIAGPAWISPQNPEQPAPGLSPGSIAILSGALHRQTLMQTACARAAMPVFDLDLTIDAARAAAGAVAWAKPYFGRAPFLISSSAPPDKIRAGAPAADILAAVAAELAAAGIRNFVLAGNDTASLILQRLGVSRLVAGAAFAGLRWLRAGDINVLIKPGCYGAKNLFLYEFEPQSRLNATAE